MCAFVACFCLYKSCPNHYYVCHFCIYRIPQTILQANRRAELGLQNAYAARGIYLLVVVLVSVYFLLLRTSFAHFFPRSVLFLAYHAIHGALWYQPAVCYCFPISNNTFHLNTSRINTSSNKSLEQMFVAVCSPVTMVTMLALPCVCR